MAKFDFLPDLHHVYSKVAFFASYEQLQSQIFKNWTFRPHLVSVIHAKNHASGTIYIQSGMVCL